MSTTITEVEQAANRAAYARLDLAAWRADCWRFAEMPRCTRCQYVDLGGVMVCRVCKRPAIVEGAK